MNYAFKHLGKAYTPEGQQPIPDVQEHNNQVERDEIAHLQTAPERITAYVKMPQDVLKTEFVSTLRGSDCGITTWMGTPIATYVWIGPRRMIGFGYHTYRRPVSCRIFGVLYHGWYMESSGNYCRLRKAKRQ